MYKLIYHVVGRFLLLRSSSVIHSRRSLKVLTPGHNLSDYPPPSPLSVFYGLKIYDAHFLPHKFYRLIHAANTLHLQRMFIT